LFLELEAEAAHELLALSDLLELQLKRNLREESGDMS
jgi:hypothetical protein